MNKNLASLCLLLVLTVPALAEPIVVRSPDKNRTWAQAEETARQFVWDAKAGKFSLFLTYTNIDEASRVASPETETLAFWIPGVTWDAARKLFVIALPDGQAIPVARKVTRLFVIPQIELLPRNHIFVQTPDGNVEVSLEVVP